MILTYALILLMVTSLGLALFLDLSLLWGFLAIATVLTLFSPNKKTTLRAGIASVIKCRSIYVVVVLLGMNVAMWMGSGLLATLIYHGLDYLSPRLFLVMAFLGSGLVAFIMGTGLGTFSTIGIVFLSLASPLGLPTPMVVGALVSGAFIADKLSFASALTQLNLKVSQTTYKVYFIASLKTLIPAILMTSLIYYFMTPTLNPLDPAMVFSEKQDLLQAFRIENALLLLPLIFVGLSFIGAPTSLSLGLMIVANGLALYFIQGQSLQTLLGYLVYGYATTPATLFHGGGILAMVEVIAIVMAAIYVSGMIAAMGLVDPLLKKTMDHTTSPAHLVFKTSLLSIFLTAITCDQTVGILMPGQHLKSSYEAMGMGPEILARTISDSGVITAPLQFWNVNALIIFGLCGLSPIDYGPYAILCYLMPVMTFFVTWISQKSPTGHRLKV